MLILLIIHTRRRARVFMLMHNPRSRFLPQPLDLRIPLLNLIIEPILVLSMMPRLVNVLGTGFGRLDFELPIVVINRERGRMGVVTHVIIELLVFSKFGSEIENFLFRV